MATGPPPLSEGVYNFGAKFLKGYREVSPNANVVFSPVSLMTSLSLVYFGSRGSTRELMDNTLDFKVWAVDMCGALNCIALGVTGLPAGPVEF